MSVKINGKEYIVRELSNEDFFNLCDILEKVDLNMDSLKEMVKGASKENAEDVQLRVGIKILMDILKQLGKARKEANIFFGALIGLQPDEFAKLKFKDTLAVIQELANQEGFADFLSQVPQFMKSR